MNRTAPFYKGCICFIVTAALLLTMCPILPAAEGNTLADVQDIAFQLATAEGNSDITYVGFRQGTVSVSGTLQNLQASTASYTAYLALYEADEETGEEVLSQLSVQAMEDVAVGGTAQLSAQVTVPEDYLNCIIRLYVWTSPGMEPVLSPSRVLRPDPVYWPETEEVNDEFDALRVRWKNYLIGGREYYDVNDPDIKAKITEMDAEVRKLMNDMQTGADRTNLWTRMARSAISCMVLPMACSVNTWPRKKR